MRGRQSATLVSLAAIALSGCGGESGGGGSAAAPPPPPMAVVPPPPPPPPPSAASPIGLTQIELFTTLSWNFRDGLPNQLAGTDQVEMTYRASKLEMLIPGAPRSGFEVFETESDQDFSLSVLRPAGGISVLLLRPGAQNRYLALDYTSAGSWSRSPIGDTGRERTHGVFGYGVPSMASAVPTSGLGHYRLLGFATSWPTTTPTGPLGHLFYGTINFDFARSSVGGSFTTGVPGEPVSITQVYSFTNLNLGANALTFSGLLDVPGLSGLAEFTGLFAGPSGQEVIIRWRGPYIEARTGATEMVYGVLVGKRS